MAAGNELERELAQTPYRWVRALARGGMAEVHVVEHRALGGQLVMKVLRESRAGLGPGLTKRLRTEGRLLQSIRHENVIDVRDFGFTTQGRAYLVMELLAGRSLREEVVARGALPVDEVVMIGRELLSGLDAAHSAGLVHRDMKPDNVFYLDGTPRRIKLLDFGIAKVLSEEAVALAGSMAPTAANMLIGTPHYIAPEQIGTGGPIDARADLYGVGGVLHYLLTGRPPFFGRSVNELLEAHLVEPAEPPSRKRPEVPAWLDAVVLRALAKNPSDRFATARLMREALVRPPSGNDVAFRLNTVPMVGAPALVGALRPVTTPSGAPPRQGAAQETIYESSPLARAELQEASRANRVAEARVPATPAPKNTQVTRRMVVPPTVFEPPSMQHPAGGLSTPETRVGRTKVVLLWLLSVIVAAMALRWLERCAFGAPAQLSGKGEGDYSATELRQESGAMVQPDAVGPKGTFRMPIVENGRLASAVTEPVFVDGEPTPVDPPSFDLAALAAYDDREAVRERELRTNHDQPDDFAPGQRFRDYVVLGPLAQGGLSWIYELSHADNRARYALKVQKPQFRRHAVMRERLFGEGKLLLNAQSNPYICRVHDVGRDDALGVFVVMELLHGRTLRALIEEKLARGSMFPVQAAVKTVISVAEGLHMMHLVGAVNRDVKPENIFVVQHGDGSTSLKILDWGAAKSPFSPHTTREEATVATALYMPPELADRRSPTGAADQYSLAFVLLELIWQHPFANAVQKGRRLAEIIGMHLSHAIERPPAHIVPEGLWNILDRATAKSPERRYPSMKAFAAALRDYLAGGVQLAPAPAALGVPFRPTVLTTRARAARPQGLAQPANPTPAPTQACEPRRRIAPGTTCERATLLVLSPAELRGQRFELGHDGVVGRHPAVSNIVIEHPTVSNEHLYYSVVNDDPEAPLYAVENRSSSNETLIDGQPIEVQALTCNRIVEIGEVRACLLPAGRVTVDLQRFDALRDAIPSPAIVARRRQPRRRLALDEMWRRPSVVVLAPAELAGERFDLGVGGIIGRELEAADVVIEHDSVSRRHVRYAMTTQGSEQEGPVFLVEDLGSSNKTVVVDRATRRRREISKDAVFAGDELRLGEVVLVLRSAGALAADGRTWLPFVVAEPAGSDVSPPRSADAGIRSAAEDRTMRYGVAAVVVLSVLAIVLGLLVLRNRGWRLGLERPAAAEVRA